MTTDYSNTEHEPGGSAPSEFEEHRAALSAALAAADRLAKLAGTTPLRNRTLDGVKVEE
jgi:hypothetical protein